MTIDRAGRPPAPRRTSTYRSYDELGIIDRGRPLRYRHGGVEDLSGIEQTRIPRSYNPHDLDDITVISSEEIPKPKRKTIEGLANGFRRTFSVRSRREPEGIPLDTYSVTCEENFATVRGAPFGRRRSLSRDRGSSLLGRSSSEGDVRIPLPRAPPANHTPRLHRCLRALGGSWKNLLLLGGMSRGGSGAGKTATAKRVPPPAVPGDAFGTPQHRHSGSSFGSQGYASCEEQAYPQPPDTPSHTRDDHSDYGSTVSGVSGVSGASGSLGKSPAGGGTFTFPPPTQPLTHKAAVYYHHQLALSDDQGIDMTQSPGRDSPGSSSGSAGSGSRHSSASLDSGRASGRMPHHHHAACHCGDTVDRVRAMIAQGLPDQDIIHAWLADLQMEEYARLFIEAGYDLPTVTRMTPEDLTAVGIKKPNHRKRLKAELANLNVPDNLPDYIPGSLEEWLRLLRLEEYGPALVAQGYRTVHDVTQLAWEDLEDMGIVRLGHQKKILLAIKRVKDIRAGKRSISSQGSIDFTRISGQIRHPRGKSLESLEDPSERASHTTFSPEAGFYYGGQWRRSYDDGDITPTNDSSYEGGGTLPRPRGLVRPRPVAKIQATPAYRDKSPDYTYDEIAYSARLQRVAYGASPHVARKPPPEPPKRQSSQYAPFTRFGQTTVEIHPEKSLPLSLPAYPSSDSLSVSLDSTGLLPPPPAPSSPPRRYDDDKLRTGSDASFKSSSSTESDSIPFANENAGTIKQNRGQIAGRPHTVDYGRAGIPLANLPRNPDKPNPLPEHKEENKSSEPVDVLNDIGNMLANLTDELDAMLEEEKRQGLADS
ncbi:caskin-1 isoform X3 [Vanessa tameamea]|uniref:Caskin-1 isoform X3 n=1 Tax=Vanessa tameamea TaxID=334116 RepID=A0A8B8HQR7_VANTA|nr:caskin-1 isoform X3 [Vanessa tameamea]XP_047529239.1 caskin-1 isoform X3 [Vanessa atalanta]